MATKRGQALMELAMGMLALALVIAALVDFTVYITKSLKMQNSLRTGSSSQSDELKVTDIAVEYIFGRDSIPIRESVHMPLTTIAK